MRAVGYRQVAEYLTGGLAFADLREQALRATEGLAKRQYTWMRKWTGVRWLGWHQRSPDGEVRGSGASALSDDPIATSHLRAAVDVIHSLLAASTDHEPIVH